MSESVRSMPWVVEHPTDSESLLTREWLVTNGLGGLRVGDGFRRRDASLSWFAHCRAALSARTDDDVQSFG